YSLGQLNFLGKEELTMSRRSYPKGSSQGKQRKSRRKASEVQLPLCRQELVALMQDSLSSFATEMGLRIASQLLEDEVARRCGPRYEHRPQRQWSRHGRQGGYVTLAGQKLALAKPRVRRTDGQGEAELETYALLQREEAMPEACLRRMVRGVSTRDYEQVVDLARQGFGVKKSSVSRGFVKASAAEIKRLAERRLDTDRIVTVFIDGKEYAGETMVVALGITEKGAKRILGLRQGGTENAEVVTSLLEDLRERGLDVSGPMLFVLDGAKALHAAVKRTFGKNAIIQRCQVHKVRNVKAHLADKHHQQLAMQLSAAYGEKSYERALAGLKTTATWLARLSPAAAASLREGMEETLTVVKLGLPDLLRRTLATTNPVESALSVAAKVTARVKRWRDGDMRQRWCAAGLIRAEEGFRRVRGHKHMPLLVEALEHTHQSIDERKKSA
ncbi:MAG: IS256 family transposase, partial [Pseudomonadota bacterium]